jgi:hypothetical protein
MWPARRAVVCPRRLLLSWWYTCTAFHMTVVTLSSCTQNLQSKINRRPGNNTRTYKTKGELYLPWHLRNHCWFACSSRVWHTQPSPGDLWEPRRGCLSGRYTNGCRWLYAPFQVIGAYLSSAVSQWRFMPQMQAHAEVRRVTSAGLTIKCESTAMGTIDYLHSSKSNT